MKAATAAAAAQPQRLMEICNGDTLTPEMFSPMIVQAPIRPSVTVLELVLVGLATTFILIADLDTIPRAHVTEAEPVIIAKMMQGRIHPQLHASARHPEHREIVQPQAIPIAGTLLNRIAAHHHPTTGAARDQVQTGTAEEEVITPIQKMEPLPIMRMRASVI